MCSQFNQCDSFLFHQKMEGMFHEAVAIPASVLNRGSSPAQSHAIMDTSNTSPTPYTLQVQGGSNNNSLSQVGLFLWPSVHFFPMRYDPFRFSIPNHCS